MWILICTVLFAAGYAAAVYSWPTIKVWVNGATAEAEKLRNRAVKLETKLRNL